MDIHHRFDHLEKRVIELEKELALLKQSQVSHPAPAPVPTLNSNPNRTPAPVHVPPTAPPKQEVIKKETDWEHLIARVWLPRIFMFVLLIGIVWGFKAAVDNGLLTEQMRCAIGYVVGGCFVFLGFKQHKANRPLLAQALLGGSIGLFMLTTFACHQLYELIGAPIAFTLNVLWVGLGLWFSHKLKSQSLAIIASAAGVLTPFLLNSNNPSSLFFVSYETLLFVSFMLYAIRNQFVGLFYTSFGLLPLALFLFGLGVHGDTKLAAMGMLAQQVALLATICLKSPTMNHQLRLLIPSFAFTAIWFKVAYTDTQFNVAMVATCIGYALISYWFSKMAQEKLPYTMTIASYALLFYSANYFSDDALPGFLLVEGIIALLLGFIVKSVLQKINGIIIYALAFATALGTITEGMSSIMSVVMLIWLLVLGTLAGMIAIVSHFGVGTNTKNALILLKYGLGFLFLCFITEITRTLTHDFSVNSQHLWVSTVWVLYAISVIAYGLKKEVKQIRLTGLALLFLTLMKVIFMDLPNVSLTIKAIMFIGLGFIGLLLSRFFYKKSSST
ncbi:DUF2339 domain-containing protein [Paenibacillus sp. Soil750]|uniref:DUF2339 domain-containing protein n=1 Tax=Paenibacillus sp. Soil750 TaxID=1736398 RepID=UPI0006FCB8A1|nr:DUF2339 domain-containing protein [Paenibacillus sp. Soil750]KRE65586.1 hypothetical protein ASL11_20040 [Paenibacillus sp. Soil750]